MQAGFIRAVLARCWGSRWRLSASGGWAASGVPGLGNGADGARGGPSPAAAAEDRAAATRPPTATPESRPPRCGRCAPVGRRASAFATTARRWARRPPPRHRPRATASIPSSSTPEVSSGFGRSAGDWAGPGGTGRGNHALLGRSVRYVGGGQRAVCPCRRGRRGGQAGMLRLPRVRADRTPAAPPSPRPGGAAPLLTRRLPGPGPRRRRRLAGSGVAQPAVGGGDGPGPRLRPHRGSYHRRRHAGGRQVDRRCLEVDPGSHRFRFEAPPWPPVERTMLISEGVKERPIDVEFAPEPATVVATSAGARSRPGSTMSSAASGRPRWRRRRRWVSGPWSSAVTCSGPCAPFCAETEVDAIKTKLLLADVALGVALVSARDCLVPRRSADPASAPTVGIGGAFEAAAGRALGRGWRF